MPNYQPHSILVTGGAGFIGANFIHHVLSVDPNVKIVNLDKLTYAGSLDNLKTLSNNTRHHFVQGDIADAKLVRHLLQHHHIDTIVHFAAESHVDRSITQPSAFVETNVMGTFVLLEAARHHWFEVETCSPSHCRFHHISTDEVYGSLSLKEPPFTEKSCYRPRSPYSASKAGGDHLVNAYYNTYQLPITLSHCSNNYGPYQHAEKFIPTIIRGCLEGETIPIYGQGKNIRDWMFVEDHCRGIWDIIQRGTVGECYDMGAKNEWENIALAKYICQEMDKVLSPKKPCESLLAFVTDRPGHDFRYAIDSSKIEKALGWSPQDSLSSGLKKTIEFYTKNAKEVLEER